MGRYNEHLQNRFRDCAMFAEAFDPHRNRNITLHILPGNEEHVGFTDGVDAFIIPIIVDQFGINLQKARSEYRDTGEPLRRKQSKKRQRVQLAVEEKAARPAKRTRLALLEE